MKTNDGIEDDEEAISMAPKPDSTAEPSASDGSDKPSEAAHPAPDSKQQTPTATTGSTDASRQEPEPEFIPPPVMNSIEDLSVADRLSSSLHDLQSKVTSVVRDSSTSVTRALRTVVPPAMRQKSPYPVVVAFGDSLTQRGNVLGDEDRGIGWTTHLASLLSARADVLTRGFSGYNSKYALEVFPYVMAGAAEEASVVLVWFGANDSVVKGRGGQHVSVEEYGLNLSKLVFEIGNFRKTNPITPILMTPPPVQQEALDARATDGPGRRLVENTKKYAQACKDVAKRMNVVCIDIHDALTKHAETQEGLKKFLCDGLHFSNEGNSFVGRYVYNKLREHVPEFSDDHLRQWFPEWGRIDPQDPSASFTRIAS